MPRLSKKQYLKYHKTLRHLWLHHIQVYGYLNMDKQWQLHDFFRPSKDLSREELLTHREAISKERPSLPHQAGWALKQLNQVLGTLASQPANGKERKLVARPIVRPEIDYDKLVRAFHMMTNRFGKEGQDKDTLNT